MKLAGSRQDTVVGPWVGRGNKGIGKEALEEEEAIWGLTHMHATWRYLQAGGPGWGWGAWGPLRRHESPMPLPQPCWCPASVQPSPLLPLARTGLVPRE